MLIPTKKEDNVMTEPHTRELFFKNFLREFRTGLRIADQPVVDQLIKDLTEISLTIPPSTHDQYTFREIIMLITLINQKTIHELKTN